ncbi:MAG: hypothetical protein J6J74_07370 [Elusimicrobiaceae bacterium]|nr:hypothetical protein [Elusimicrobiaceae bacterium]
MFDIIKSLLISLFKQSLDIKSREVKLFIFEDAFYCLSMRIVNTGTLPITILMLAVKTGEEVEILKEWKDLFLEPGKKEEIYLNLDDITLNKSSRIYVVSADGTKFYLSKKEYLKLV